MVQLPQNETLALVNMQCPSALPFLHAVAEYLARHTGLPIELDERGFWWQRRDRLFRGDAQLGFLCGLPYARKADEDESCVELLAAPVMASPRYEGRPVYFSDVVVRHDSGLHEFSELEGRRWAYNEPESHSGYWLTRYVLAERGVKPGFFGSVRESGSHRAAIAMLLAGEVDGAAIDSTVLEAEIRNRPALAGELRVLETWGPSPVPPLLISAGVAAAIKQNLRQALVTMHESPEGRAALEVGMAARFIAVDDAAYNAIRRMARVAEGYPLAWDPSVTSH